MIFLKSVSAIRLNNFLYQNGRITDFIDLGDVALFGDLFFVKVGAVSKKDEIFCERKASKFLTLPIRTPRKTPRIYANAKTRNKSHFSRTIVLLMMARCWLFFAIITHCTNL